MSLRPSYVPSTQPVAGVESHRFTWIHRIDLPGTAWMLVALFCLTAGTQALSNATIAGFGGAADEGAHYVTALMIRDYVADGMPSSPIAYAERYYLHYPKVAFGIWPPLFHLIAGVWLLLVGSSTSSALTFVALITAFFALCVYFVARKLFDAVSGAIAAVWLLMLPAVQVASTVFMMDMLCAALMFLAAAAYGMYLKSGHTRYSCAFGLLAAAAIMTKYNAFALALLPPIAILAARRLDLVGRVNFWAPALIVIAICGPWYVVQADLVWYASQPYSTLDETPQILALNSMALASSIHWVLFPLVCLGCWMKTVHSRKADDGGLWAAFFGLLISVWIFHSLLYPTHDERYLLAASATIVLFLCAGVDVVLKRVSAGVSHERRRHAILLLAGVIYLTTTFRIPVKEDRGLARAAEELMLTGVSSESTLLVSSDAQGEGAFVAAVAARDRRPNVIVLRASKILASSTWMGADYRLLYSDETEVRKVLDSARVSHVVIDLSLEVPLPHDLQLMHTLNASAEWAQIPRPYPALRMYRRTNLLPAGRPEIEVDMNHSLGRRLVY